jgi:hypothetical protein
MKKIFLCLITAFVATGFVRLSAGEIKTGKQQTKLEYTQNGFSAVTFHSLVSAVQFREVMTTQGPFTELFIPGHFNAPVPGDPNLPASCRVLLTRTDQVSVPTAHCRLTLNTTHLATGVYYCTIRTNQITTVKKIIITKQ